MRVQSDKPTTNGGWLHRLVDAAVEPPAPRRRRIAIAATRQPTDLDRMSELMTEAVDDEQLVDFAVQLGVACAALRATRIGWHRERQAWSWPMHDSRGQVVGIRLRDARTGGKYAVKGSRQGLFLADESAAAPISPLLVTEGPTDLAAAITLGFHALGRPSCTGSIKPVVSMTRGRDVAVVADRDSAGQRGAKALATALLPTVRSVRVVAPPDPFKDLRAWLRGGARHEDLQALLDACRPDRISVRLLP